MKISRSFNHAWHGLLYCYKTQVNFHIHLVVLLMVIIAGFALRISNTEWLFIIVCSTIVLALELVNTAIEQLCNMNTKEIHPVIKVIKDVSAAAVLVGAAGSAAAGFIIFLPKIIDLIY